MTQHPSFQSVARRSAVAAALLAALLAALALLGLYAQHRSDDAQSFRDEIRPLALAWSGAGSRGGDVVEAVMEGGGDRGVVVVGDAGAVLARGGAPIFGNDPDELAPTPGTVSRVEAAGTAYLAGVTEARGDGTRFYYARAARPWPFVLPLLAALALVGLAAGAAFWFVRRAVGESSAEAADDLAELARRVAGRQFAEDTEARLRSEATERFGAVVEPLFTMSEALTLLKTRVADAEQEAKALLHVNPHYVVVVGANGKVADANPAFFAMSGLPAKKTRGASVKILDTVLPLDPLAKHAARAASGATVQGIDYAVMAKGNRKRRVKVSMRKTRVGGADALVIQATDVEREQELQHQVDDFFDTFDLKVEQRLHELASGQGMAASGQA